MCRRGSWRCWGSWPNELVCDNNSFFSVRPSHESGNPLALHVTVHIMSLPRYAKYKDSGVEWLGDIPTHWEIAPLKWMLDIQNGSDHKHVETDEGHPVIGSGGPFTYASQYLYDGESVLLGRKGTVDKPLYVTGKFWTVDTMYWTKISPAACGKFCYYAALTIPFDLYSTNTALPSMTKGVLSAHPIARPSFEEQSDIAAFLDRETGKIDALIAEQEKLLTLLAEKRQATVSHAVTRGLNPNAPMKDSGVPWLGEVPAHWIVSKCGQYLSILSGFAFPSSRFSQDESDVKLLRGVNVGVSALRWEDVVYWRREIGDRLDAYELRTGDLVIGMDRPLIADGMRVARVKEGDLPCLLLQRVASIKAGPLLSTGFLMYLLASEMFVAHFAPEVSGVSVPHISPDQIASFVIPLPPIEEQASILFFLDAEVVKLEVLEAQTARAVVLLKERRSALIAAAVTGKIDVRGIA